MADEEEMDEMDEILDGDVAPDPEAAVEDAEPDAMDEPVFAAPPAPPAPPAPKPHGLLDDIELEATLQFGFREMPLRDLMGLAAGDVVELNRHVSEPVELVIGDRILARGEVVVANGNFALRIIEVAAPQLRLESIGCLI
jgi:flagellar motor switch protein FliN/FliY